MGEKLAKTYQLYYVQLPKYQEGSHLCFSLFLLKRSLNTVTLWLQYQLKALNDNLPISASTEGNILCPGTSQLVTVKGTSFTVDRHRLGFAASPLSCLKDTGDWDYHHGETHGPFGTGQIPLPET